VFFNDVDDLALDISDTFPDQGCLTALFAYDENQYMKKLSLAAAGAQSLLSPNNYLMRKSGEVL